MNMPIGCRLSQTAELLRINPTTKTVRHPLKHYRQLVLTAISYCNKRNPLWVPNRFGLLKQ